MFSERLILSQRSFTANSKISQHITEYHRISHYKTDLVDTMPTDSRSPFVPAVLAARGENNKQMSLLVNIYSVM